MNIQYTQPEANQTELSRKVRGARLECERLELQLEANLRRIIGQVDCSRCKHNSEACEYTLPSECPRFEPRAKPGVALIALALLLGGCGIASPEMDSTDAGDAAVLVDAAADTCDRGSWTVRADNTLAPDMWAGGEVVCVKTQELPNEDAALWTCHAACADVVSQ
jgi:hypothetical protein